MKETPLLEPARRFDEIAKCVVSVTKGDDSDTKRKLA
jgi:hypothetical protein